MKVLAFALEGALTLFTRPAHAQLAAVEKKLVASVV